jgi:hypothetical protein
MFLVLQHFNGNNDADGNEDEEEYEEADPALSACRSCRYDSLFGVAKTAKGDEKQTLHDSRTLTQFRHLSQLPKPEPR